MKKLLTLLFAVTFLTSASALTVEEIIKKVDFNMAPQSVIYHAEMKIVKPGKTLTKKMKMYGKGTETGFIEFLSPPRDKGTRYLRLGDDLWMFLPRASRTVKISGHMLRQSMMGSDISYEDQTERHEFWDIYECSLTSDEVYDSREVYTLTLTAKPGEEVTYYKRKIWVDKDNYVVHRSEMYAKSGKLLKIMHIMKYIQVGDRYYSSHMRMEDKIRGNTYTDIIMTDIELDVEIPDRIFSMQNLERRK